MQSLISFSSSIFTDSHALPRDRRYFSAVFMGGVLHGKTMKDAASHAMDTVRRMIEKNLGSREPFKGIPIETCLEVLD